MVSTLPNEQTNETNSIYTYFLGAVHKLCRFKIGNF